MEYPGNYRITGQLSNTRAIQPTLQPTRRSGGFLVVRTLFAVLDQSGIAHLEPLSDIGNQAKAGLFLTAANADQECQLLKILLI